MRSEIVLIGPFDVGKTTIARLLGGKLGVPVASLDDVCYDYYKEIGWCAEDARRINERDGGDAFVAYTCSFEPYGVEQVLARNPGCIIDMGGGQTVSDVPAHFRRVQEALAPYINVVLLLVSPDPDETLMVLRRRRHLDSLEYVVRSPCYYALAKHIVYTEHKSPEQVRDEVLDRVTL
jgi:shikimate kinase